MRRLTVTVPLALLALVATATPAVACRSAEEPAQARAVLAEHQRAVPQLKVTKRVTGLSNPWDVKSLGNGRLLVTERDTARVLRGRQGRQATGRRSRATRSGSRARPG